MNVTLILIFCYICCSYFIYVILFICPGGYLSKYTYDLNNLITNIENKQQEITTEIENKNYITSRELYIDEESCIIGKDCLNVVL